MASAASRTHAHAECMESPHSESLEASIEKLANLNEAHLETGRQMFEAFGGAVYGVDWLAAGD